MERKCINTAHTPVTMDCLLPVESCYILKLAGWSLTKKWKREKPENFLTTVYTHQTHTGRHAAAQRHTLDVLVHLHPCLSEDTRSITRFVTPWPLPCDAGHWNSRSGPPRKWAGVLNKSSETARHLILGTQPDTASCYILNTQIF